ncbi:MAG: chemotaxis protein CheW [Cyanobacteria bacterium SBLK]|nr:chemotaxis protein CheW [Cyanobacteria bacterium SBLK]
MQDNCWTQIGIRGDRTCPQLETVVHCQNCPIYSQAGRELFDRPPPEGYIDGWMKKLAVPRDRQQEHDNEMLSLCLFRLGQEWLALPAEMVDRATNPSPVHSLPHRSDRIVRGLVNLRGQLLLCVSLHELLGISELAETKIERVPGCYPRLLAIRKQQDIWTFATQEFYGLHRCPRENLRNAPAFNCKILDSFTRGILPWGDRHASYLDAELLFAALRQKI